MDLEKLAQSLHPLERRILPFLHDNITLTEIAAKSKLNESEVTHALKWMQNKNLINIKSSSYDLIVLDKNALFYLKNGLPERILTNLLKDKAMTLAQIRAHFMGK